VHANALNAVLYANANAEITYIKSAVDATYYTG